MNSKQQKILDSVLAAVPREGWTAQSFLAGVKASGIRAAEADKIFPQGIADIVAAFHGSINEAMQARIAQKRNFAAMRVRDKVTFAVRARLEAVAKNRDAMRRLLVWAVMPQHIRQSTALLWQAADAIWIAAGDRSTDYNYYTKRLLLIAVMKSVLSFWLNDESAGCAESWDFLDRRIADVMTIGKGMSVIKTVGLSDIIGFVKTRRAA